MGWIYLLLAGLAEIGWPVGLKLAQNQANRWLGLSIAIIFMTISGVLLYIAQRSIPIGTAYAVWTGLGAAGTFIIGVWFFGDSTSFLRFLGVALIMGGVTTLKMADQ
ncbi:MAG: multidrug efflux SMR transporter [Leptonema sp. (in: Bacteria)]|nr:multidrug efflux SMR transporter [Leptonema sp. (in: bacteria)]